MNVVRSVSTLILVVAICLLAIFQMKIRGFEEVERINAWVLYYDANGDLDENMDYPKFIVKSGFEEKTLDEAIEEGLFDQNELELIYVLIEEYE